VEGGGAEEKVKSRSYLIGASFWLPIIGPKFAEWEQTKTKGEKSEART